MTLCWVVTVEWNCGEFGVCAVYATEALAQAARAALVSQAKAEHKVVWAEQGWLDQAGEDDWDVDYTVEAYEVLTALK